MRKVAGYVRVSREEQSREGISLDAQRARIAAYCAMRGLELAQIVEDPGVSAAKALRARPGGEAPPRLTAEPHGNGNRRIQARSLLS